MYRFDYIFADLKTDFASDSLLETVEKLKLGSQDWKHHIQTRKLKRSRDVFGVFEGLLRKNSLKIGRSHKKFFQAWQITYKKIKPIQSYL